MMLEDFRKMEGLSYENLARKLDVTTNTARSICQGGGCVKMIVAQRIVKMTAGVVGFEDLIPDGDC